MGTGGIMAMGCTIGQGMTGIASLSVTAFLATGGIIAGAVLGIRYLIEGRLPDVTALIARLLGNR